MVFNASVYAAKACDKAFGCNDDEHTPCLQRKIQEYFDGDGDGDGDADFHFQKDQNRLRISDY